MQVQTKTTGIALTPDIAAYLEKKTTALERLVSPQAKLYVELARETEHHEKGTIYRAEFNFHSPGKDARAVGESADILSAIDQAKDELAEQLRTKKDKDKTLFRRGAKQVKDYLQSWNPWRGE